MFVQTVFSGLVNGSVYALMGLAVVLYFRSSRVINLAHGETFMATGIITAKAVSWGWPLAAGAGLGLVVAVMATLFLERVILRSRLHWDPSRLILVTLGVAFVARGLAIWQVGTTPYSFQPLVSGAPVEVAGAAFSRQGILTVVVTLIVGISMTWFFKRTVVGHAMTASSENPAATSLLGVNVGLMRQLSYGIAALLGVLSALLIVPLSFVTYDVGLSFVLKGYIAAAVASMVDPQRAFLAGLGLGIAEAMVGSYIDPLLRTPFVFGLFLLAVVAFLGRQVRFGGVVRA